MDIPPGKDYNKKECLLLAEKETEIWKENMIMSECNHDCGSCSANCESRTTDKTSFLEALAPESKVKKVIGIVSGKGGVGKSLVTSMLAVSMNRKGHHTAILDADITGPSIPMAFGVARRETGCDSGWTSDDSGKILRGRGDHVCQSAS